MVQRVKKPVLSHAQAGWKSGLPVLLENLLVNAQQEAK